jgi:hypothetical protein
MRALDTTSVHCVDAADQKNFPLAAADRLAIKNFFPQGLMNILISFAFFSLFKLPAL